MMLCAWGCTEPADLTIVEQSDGGPCQGEDCPDRVPVTCAVAEDCPQDGACVEQVCLPCDADLCPLPDSIDCESFDDCDVGLICVEGSCVEPDAGCRIAADCPESSTCDGGQCLVIPPDCEGTPDCADGRLCKEGHCTGLPPCDADGTCGERADEVCVSHVCTRPCTATAECWANFECKGGGCLPDGR